MIFRFLGYGDPRKLSFFVGLVPFILPQAFLFVRTRIREIVQLAALID